MKNSIVYLGILLMSFANAAFANTMESATALEMSIPPVGTPLCIAISKGDTEAVKKFLEYGSGVNEMSNGMTPLMLAARYNNVTIMEMLIEKGANIKTKDARGFTAQKHAELSKANEAVAYLQQLSKTKNS